MRLSPAAFNAFIGGIGQDFLWRRAYTCPNINPHSGAGDFNCPMCGGKGWFWPGAPVPGKAGMTSQGVQRKFSPLGLYMDGDTILTLPSNSPLYEIGQMDRVIALDASSRFSQIMTHDGTDKLDRTAPTIDRVFWLNDAKTAMIDGGIPSIAADGTLTWVNGEPPAGAQYSLNGTAKSEYFAYRDLPSNRMEHSGALLPKKVHLRVIDLFGR